MGTEQTPESSGGARETELNESWALIRPSPIGALAVIHDSEPDSFPVSHAVEHGLTAPWCSAPRVAREVSEIDDAIALMGMPLLTWHASDKPHVLRILPETVTGRRFTVAPGSVRPASPR